MGAYSAPICALLHWDTAFFGVPIAQVQSDALTGQNAVQIDAWCLENRVRCLYFLAACGDPETSRLATAHGFQLVDVRITFELTDILPRTHSASHTASRAVVRPFVADDMSALARIARVSHRDTRFYFDTNFPRHQCDALYETWIVRSCEGYADAVLVAELDGACVGYISCHTSMESATGKIGLVGVSERVQGQGIGQELVRQAVASFAMRHVQSVSVVTQARNTAAQRLYQRCGFLTREIRLWYHKWYLPV